MNNIHEKIMKYNKYNEKLDNNNINNIDLKIKYLNKIINKLNNDIILTGGTDKFENFYERLINELNKFIVNNNILNDTLIQNMHVINREILNLNRMKIKLATEQIKYKNSNDKLIKDILGLIKIKTQIKKEHDKIKEQIRIINS